MRNHSFSSLSTAAYEHENEPQLDEDPYDLNLSVSSLAKLNRRKPQVSTILKLNLIVVLIISLFIKLTVVSIINGSLSAFLALKLLTHGLILYTFIKKHYISLQLLFVLDVILFVIFLMFEFLLLVSNFAIIIIQHKRNKNLGFIGIWLMILIAAIDLLILVMCAIVLENYRRPKERLQQLEAKLVTVVHNGRLLASQMCKSGSYLLGFVCNSSAAAATGAPASATAVHPQSSTANGMLANGTPRIFRDSEDPSQRISCIDTGSVNDDEYVHYSSQNRFPSFSDFYNFNNRNANLSSLNDSSDAGPTNDAQNASLTTSTIVASINAPPAASSARLPPMASTNSTVSPSHLSNGLTNAAVSGCSSALTTLASSSDFGTPIACTHQLPSLNHLPFGQPFKFMNGSGGIPLTSQTISSLVNSNTSLARRSPAEEQQSTYVHMYQSNVDEDGDPVDGPLRCTRTTVLNAGSTESGPSSSSAHTVVQMQQQPGRGVLNCKPVYI